MTIMEPEDEIKLLHERIAGLQKRVSELEGATAQGRCRVCAPDCERGCAAKSECGFSCTREAGHAGHHVACGSDEHWIAAWPK